MIDYVIGNEKMSKQIKDVRVFRGSDINFDHFFVIAKVSLLAKWKKSKTSTRLTRNKGEA